MDSLLKKHSDIIQKIWESSGHGTERVDIERAFLAGHEAARKPPTVKLTDSKGNCHEIIGLTE